MHRYECVCARTREHTCACERECVCVPCTHIPSAISSLNPSFSIFPKDVRTKYIKTQASLEHTGPGDNFLNSCRH